MKTIAIIDDEESELRLWSLIQKRHFQDQIEFVLFQTIEPAIEAIAQESFDAVIVDNNIPPHSTAQFALDQLSELGFTGPIIVFSNHQIDDLAKLIGSVGENVKLISKLEHIGVSKMVGLVRDLKLIRS